MDGPRRFGSLRARLLSGRNGRAGSSKKKAAAGHRDSLLAGITPEVVEKTMKREKLAHPLLEDATGVFHFASTLAAWQGEWHIFLLISLAGITPEVVEKTRRGEGFVPVLHEYVIRTPLFRLVCVGGLAGRATRIRDDLPCRDNPRNC